MKTVTKILDRRHRQLVRYKKVCSDCKTPVQLDFLLCTKCKEKFKGTEKLIVAAK